MKILNKISSFWNRVKALNLFVFDRIFPVKQKSYEILKDVLSVVEKEYFISKVSIKGVELTMSPKVREKIKKIPVGDAEEESKKNKYLNPADDLWPED